MFPALQTRQVAPRDALGGDDDDAPSTTAAKKSKRQKQREKEERERTVRERELALADGTDAPASADDFERRIMARVLLMIINNLRTLCTHA